MSKYIEVGSRVEYKEGDTIRTGRVIEIKSRSSIGYTTWEVYINPDHANRRVMRLRGGTYPHYVKVLDD